MEPEEITDLVDADDDRDETQSPDNLLPGEDGSFSERDWGEVVDVRGSKDFAAIDNADLNKPLYGSGNDAIYTQSGRCSAARQQPSGYIPYVVVSHDLYDDVHVKAYDSSDGVGTKADKADVATFVALWSGAQRGKIMDRGWQRCILTERGAPRYTGIQTGLTARARAARDDTRGKRAAEQPQHLRG